MGDIARYSLSPKGEDHLYKILGPHAAQLLIDHAFGWEPCDIADVKAYRPISNSLSSGQILHCAYTAEKGRIIAIEMADRLALDMVDKDLVTDQIILTIGYDRESLDDPEFCKNYKGEIMTDHYGRSIPKYAHGTTNLEYTSSSHLIVDAVTDLYDCIVDKNLLIRRITIAVNHVISEKTLEGKKVPEQLNLFMDIEEAEKKRESEIVARQKEKNLQKAILQIQKKYGKNALLKGTNLLEGATMKERNLQVGGHKA